jgi:hypothetical protein
MKQPTHRQRIERILQAILNSPNKSKQRAALWLKIHNLKHKTA